MRRVLRGLAAVTALCLVALAFLLAASPFLDGPVGPMPGGALRAGALVALPSHWPEDAVGPTVELETNVERPWSVTTWAVALDGALYVPADFLNPVKRWPSLVAADPRVVVRVRGNRYAGHATWIRDPETIARLRAAFARKYDLAPDGRAARAEVWFLRIDP
ncbi:MAG TPA: hypothetical protein VMW35_03085 [Myxococcota bacterium]|jgi:hypothetical protein|nr:hypothetical protein [Myxococcota bacterium]